MNLIITYILICFTLNQVVINVTSKILKIKDSYLHKLVLKIAIIIILILNVNFKNCVLDE